MSNLDFKRIESRLDNIFNGEIYDDDIKGTDNYEQKWRSRAYTAYAVQMLGNEKVKDAANCITDGFNDFGIDAIYNDSENQKLYLLQTKFSETKSIELGELHKFIDGVKKILDLKFDDFNERIINRKSEIEEALLNFDYTIELVIVLGSNQLLSKDAKKVLDDFINMVNDNAGIISDKIIVFKDVYTHMGDSTSLDKITVENFYLQNYGSLKSEGDTTVYYGVTSAMQIAGLREKFGIALLQKNIRNFKKNTDVNNGIMKVLEDEPENFYLFNNGIKIIAEKIKTAPINSGDKSVVILRLEGASIINGAQTTGCIYEVYKDNKEKLDEVKVQVQIISLEKLVEGMSDKITKLSNTQNRIENRDFAVQDPVQDKLKRDLAIDGYTYVYKQGESESISSDKICSIDEATVALGCALEDVNISTTIKRAYGSIFDDLTKAPYKMIFNNGVSSCKLWNSVMVYRAFQDVEEGFRKKPENYDKRLISVHGNRMLLHLILNVIIKEKPDFLKKYYDDVSIFEVSKRYESMINKLYDAKIDLYSDAYPAYIFKNQKKCKELESKILNLNCQVKIDDKTKSTKKDHSKGADR